jgi:hypothetical protein
MGSQADRPSIRDPELTGLEVWLAGTVAELDAATDALAALGRVAWRSRTTLPAAEYGRAHRYLRLSIATARPAPGARKHEDQGAIDLTEGTAA